MDDDDARIIHMMRENRRINKEVSPVARFIGVATGILICATLLACTLLLCIGTLRFLIRKVFG